MAETPIDARAVARAGEPQVVEPRPFEPRVSRRAFTAAAAWSVPVVVAAIASPHASASTESGTVTYLTGSWDPLLGGSASFVLNPAPGPVLFAAYFTFSNTNVALDAETGFAYGDDPADSLIDLKFATQNAPGPDDVTLYVTIPGYDSLAVVF
ncbi:MAG: hypothetical protein JWQ64_309 [Subtercola sp.]|nr:hypothetical protein [Subtercola sp.]